VPSGQSGQVPGPLIKVNQGTRVVMAMHNQLPGVHPTFGTPLKISTHLHGSASLPQYDGYANDVTPSGMKKFYHYPNFQPARTLWYHDHGVHFTAQNAYSGLAAQYHLHDPIERELLPQGEYDVTGTAVGALADAGRNPYIGT
jgi:FtsP/CotA-like multicopper oxidase with cupredoxin domain